MRVSNVSKSLQVIVAKQGDSVDTFEENERLVLSDNNVMRQMRHRVLDYSILIYFINQYKHNIT